MAVFEWPSMQKDAFFNYETMLTIPTANVEFEVFAFTVHYCGVYFKPLIIILMIATLPQLAFRSHTPLLRPTNH